MLELSQLVKTLEEELGVSAAAAMPVAMVGAMPGDAAGAPVEEKTEFDVTLTDIGSEKIKVIKSRPRGHQSRAEGSERSRRKRPEVGQGGRDQG